MLTSPPRFTGLNTRVHISINLWCLDLLSPSDNLRAERFDEIGFTKRQMKLNATAIATMSRWTDISAETPNEEELCMEKMGSNASVLFPRLLCIRVPQECIFIQTARPNTSLKGAQVSAN